MRYAVPAAMVNITEARRQCEFFIAEMESSQLRRRWRRTEAPQGTRTLRPAYRPNACTADTLVPYILPRED